MTLNETSSELSSEPPIEPLAQAPSEPGEQVVTVIGFGRRLVAYLIDGAILWAIGLCLSVGGAAVIAGAGEDAAGINLTLQCLSMLIALAYFVVFWATSGQTPGKMALGIKVVETDGSPVTWGKAVLRYIGYIISAVVVFLGFIWVAFDSKRQGWHDKIANTYVVRKETEFSGTDVTIVPSDEGSSTAIVLVVLAFIVIVLAPIVVIAILLLLGPVIGNVFSNIVEGLTTPVPQ